MKLAAKHSNTPDIAAQLNTQCEVDRCIHREMLLKLLSCIRFLGRQGLPLRGHKEDNESFEGNLYQLLLLQADAKMNNWLQKREYISPEIVNEIITIMGQTVLRQILADIKGGMWFSLIADEATDISRNEQMCISVGR